MSLQPGPGGDSSAAERAELVGRLRQVLTEWFLTADDWREFEEALEELAADHGISDAVGRRTLLDILKVHGPHWGDFDTVPAPESTRRLLDDLSRSLGMDTTDRPAPASEAVDGRWAGASPETPSEQAPTRFVNALVVNPDNDSPVATDRPLAAASRYDLLVNIGGEHPQSLLAGGDAEFPDELLPEGDLQLRAVLTLEHRPEVAVVPFTLPARGESFTCDCPPGAPHAAGCARRPWVRFELPTPERPGDWHGSLVIYYQVVAVYAIELSLRVGGTEGGIGATVTYRLTRSFENLDTLSGRTASILVSADASHLTLNGLSFLNSPYSIDMNAADSAIRDARTLLYDIHFGQSRRRFLCFGARRRYSRFDRSYGKSQDAFVADLRRLAYVGRQFYAGLFRGCGDAATVMHSLLRQEANIRSAPPTLCICEPHAVHEGRHPSVPWSLVYDLPVGSDPKRYRLCDSVKEFGPDGGAAEIPARCPHSDHAGPDGLDVLCPFGFWGLSSVVEQPPSVAVDVACVVNGDNVPKVLFFATSSGLDPSITRAHLERLRTALDGDTAVIPLPTGEDLMAALAAEDMDIAYLYCHCGYQRMSERSTPSLYLQIGDRRVGPVDIQSWAQAAWPRPHWPKRKPLVVLNGCHTAEMTSSTLSTFVNAFVAIGGAAGMIGTEVAVEQGLAAAFMEQFLDRFAAGETVGAALRETRWHFLGMGNVMGLAYTPYSLSSLRIRAGEPLTQLTRQAVPTVL